MKNKIEFIKKTNEVGDVFYFTEFNGDRVSSSINMCQETAKKYYDAILSRNSIEDIREIIATNQ